MNVIFTNYKNSSFLDITVSRWDKDACFDMYGNSISYKFLADNLLNNIYVTNIQDQLFVQHEIDTNNGFLNQFGVNNINSNTAKGSKRNKKNKKKRVTKRNRN